MNNKLYKTYLLLGGNLGNRAENLAEAIALIANSVGEILKKSAVYETDAWGSEIPQPAHLNQAVLVATELEPQTLLEELQNIENKLGRTRQVVWGNRTIDIDIIFFDNTIMNTASLIIPHPRMQNRKFVLVPLADIALEIVHPIFQENVAKLLLECSDKLEVKKWKNL